MERRQLVFTVFQRYILEYERSGACLCAVICADGSSSMNGLMSRYNTWSVGSHFLFSYRDIFVIKVGN